MAKTKKKATRAGKGAVKKAKARSRTAKRKAKSPTRAGRASAQKRGAKGAGASRATKAAPRRAAAKKAAPMRRPPTLDRERRRVSDAEVVPTPPSSLNMDRSASAVRSGRAEFADKLREHTSTGPVMTGGDVDADWESAETVGDEAPGGDNPTPDQDVVDEIGKALGVEYEDDEELQGGDEIIERDRRRWELDPASRDDFDEE
jgi:hypothetical protein